MRSFKEYSRYKDTDTEMLATVLEYIAFCYPLITKKETIEESWERINSNVISEEFSVNGILSKMGLSVHKTGPGLIDALKSAGKGMFKFFGHAVTGNKKEIQKMLNKEITKEEVIDFLLKLDTATLHLISGPIHTMEALTGWHISANLKHKMKEVHSTSVSKIKDALNFIKKKLELTTDKTAKTISKVVDKIMSGAPEYILEI